MRMSTPHRFHLGFDNTFLSMLHAETRILESSKRKEDVQTYCGLTQDSWCFSPLVILRASLKMVQHYNQEKDLVSVRYYQCKAVDYYNMCSKLLEDSHKELNAPPWNNLPASASPAEVTGLEVATSETIHSPVNDNSDIHIYDEAEVDFMTSTGSPGTHAEITFQAHEQAGSPGPATTEDHTGQERHYDKAYGSADDSAPVPEKRVQGFVEQEVYNQEFPNDELRADRDHALRREMAVLADLEVQISRLSTTNAHLRLELPGGGRLHGNIRTSPAGAATGHSDGPTLPIPIFADVLHYATERTMEQLRTKVEQKETEVTILKNEKAALEVQLAESHNLRRRNPRSGQRPRSSTDVLRARFDPVEDDVRRKDFTKMDIPAFPKETVEVHETVRTQETAARPTEPNRRIASPLQELVTTRKEESDSGDDMVSLFEDSATPLSKSAGRRLPADNEGLVSPPKDEADSDDPLLGLGSTRSRRKTKFEKDDATLNKKLVRNPIKPSDSEEDDPPHLEGSRSPQSTTDRSTRKRSLDQARGDGITSKKKRVTSPIELPGPPEAAKFGEDEEPPWERPRPPPRTPRRGPPKRRLPQAEEDVVTPKKKLVRTLKELSDSDEKATPKRKLIRPPKVDSDSPEDIKFEGKAMPAGQTVIPSQGTPDRSAKKRRRDELEGGATRYDWKWTNPEPQPKRKPWYDDESDEDIET